MALSVVRDMNTAFGRLCVATGAIAYWLVRHLAATGEPPAAVLDATHGILAGRDNSRATARNERVTYSRILTTRAATTNRSTIGASLPDVLLQALEVALHRRQQVVVASCGGHLEAHARGSRALEHEDTARECPLR